MIVDPIPSKNPNRIGNKNPNWRGGKIKVPCHSCGMELMLNQYKIKTHKKSFCSRACKALYQKSLTKELHPNWKGGNVKKKCIVCGAEIEVIPSQANNPNIGKYCSPQCHGKWKTDNQRGANNPSWAGGVTPERQAYYRSREWKKACVKIWVKYKSICQRCGVKYKDYEGDFHIHHLESFKNKAFRTDTNNLTLLCSKCHNFVHSKKNINGEFIDKGQSKLLSLTESIVNIIFGYWLAFWTQVIIFPWFGIVGVSHKTNLAMGGVFTIVSLLRSYALRRAFNRLKR